MRRAAPVASGASGIRVEKAEGTRDKPSNIRKTVTSMVMSICLP
jgi:hypothetical protein